MAPRHAIVGSALVLIAAGQLFPQRAMSQQRPGSVGAVVDSQVDADAKTAFEAMPQADRKAIQDALVWSGDYSGISDGTFGKGTLSAIKAYQTRAKAKADGILDAPSMTALLAGATKAREAAGFTVIDDQKSKIRIGAPLKLLDQRGAGPSGGIFKAKDNSLSLEAFTEDASKVTLAELFSRLTADASRHVTYKLLRPDFFVVTGEAGGKRFFSRVASGPEGIRGFTFSFPPRPGFDRISVAIANSFVPFPEAAKAAMTAPGAVTNAPATPNVAGQAQSPALRLAAFVLGRQQILTVAPPGGCALPAVAGGPAKVLRSDASTGLLLLERSGSGAPAPAITWRPSELQPNETILVLSSKADGEANVSVASGEAPSASRIQAPLQAPSGSLVFDRSGALAGIVPFQANVQRLPNGIVPQASYPIISASSIKSFLAVTDPLTETAVPGAPATTAGAVAAKYGRALLSVSCGG